MPCLPGHPEILSEEFNGGLLVINPLPAGSSTNFSVIVGIHLLSPVEKLISRGTPEALPKFCFSLLIFVTSGAPLI